MTNPVPYQSCQTYCEDVITLFSGQWYQMPKINPRGPKPQVNVDQLLAECHSEHAQGQSLGYDASHKPTAQIQRGNFVTCTR